MCVSATLWGTAEGLTVRLIIDFWVGGMCRYHNPTQHWELVKIMIPEVMKLQPRYNKAVADEDCDEEKLLVRVFATMARSYIGLILGDQDIGQVQRRSCLSLAHAHTMH